MSLESWRIELGGRCIARKAGFHPNVQKPMMERARLDSERRVLLTLGVPSCFSTADMKAEDFTKEIQNLKSLKHEKLIQLHAVCSRGEPVFIITELMKKGNLQSYLNSQYRPALSTVHQGGRQRACRWMAMLRLGQAAFAAQG